MQNQSLYSTNISGVPGIGWREDQRKWQVRKGKKYIGVYTTLDDAKCALKEYNERPGYRNLFVNSTD